MTEKDTIKCVECGKISVPDYSKWGSKPNLCDKCLSIGWVSTDTPEGRKILDNDKLGKKVNTLSPYFKRTN